MTAAQLDAAPDHLFGVVSVLGVVATLAAWSEAGDAWLDTARAHLRRNRDQVAKRLAAEAPRIGHIPPEAGYLAWLNFRSIDLQPSPAAMLLETARVALDPGEAYGPGGEGFARLNFATSADLLAEILDRLLGVPELQR